VGPSNGIGGVEKRKTLLRFPGRSTRSLVTIQTVRRRKKRLLKGIFVKIGCWNMNWTTLVLRRTVDKPSGSITKEQLFNKCLSTAQGIPVVLNNNNNNNKKKKKKTKEEEEEEEKPCIRSLHT
jgi:hypothetical protein